MNKQELIDKLKKQLATPSEIDETYFNKFYELAINYALYFAEQLDEPEKPVVPQYVADFYESIKDDFEDKVYDLCVQFNLDESELNSDVSGWFDQSKNRPIETLVMMHKFGYEVEKEKLYTVEIPNPNGGTYLVLCKDCDGKLFVETFLTKDWETFGKCKLTEAEIKQDFDWARQFAKEVEE